VITLVSCNGDVGVKAEAARAGTKRPAACRLGFTVLGTGDKACIWLHHSRTPGRAATQCGAIELGEQRLAKRQVVASVTVASEPAALEQTKRFAGDSRKNSLDVIITRRW